MAGVDTAELAGIEQLCWKLTGWQCDQWIVDELLAAINAYVTGQGAEALVSVGRQPCPECAERASEAPAGVQAPDASPPPSPGPEGGIRTFQLTGTFTGTLTPGTLTVREPDALPEPEPGHQRATDPIVQLHPVPTGAPTRVCRKADCHADGQPQPLGEFCRDSKAGGGRKHACRTCENQRKRESRARKTAAARDAKVP